MRTNSYRSVMTRSWRRSWIIFQSVFLNSGMQMWLIKLSFVSQKLWHISPLVSCPPPARRLEALVVIVENVKHHNSLVLALAHWVAIQLRERVFDPGSYQYLMRGTTSFPNVYMAGDWIVNRHGSWSQVCNHLHPKATWNSIIILNVVVPKPMLHVEQILG